MRLTSSFFFSLSVGAGAFTLTGKVSAALLGFAALFAVCSSIVLSAEYIVKELKPKE